MVALRSLPTSGTDTRSKPLVETPVVLTPMPVRPSGVMVWMLYWGPAVNTESVLPAPSILRMNAPMMLPRATANTMLWPSGVKMAS